ncbi:hypothetical protein L210DRAFT_987142 [Boletus edulis BED1]|uniref:Uncharacterized protein n=1 Tax=Boletus edulis BED1 TaxID=1328754 RepID=A0AAD4BFG0_BOLED|nr:hypothetical protein L210DRAFT_987142 [Boletus edulis BED1]
MGQWKHSSGLVLVLDVVELRRAKHEHALHVKNRSFLVDLGGTNPDVDWEAAPASDAHSVQCTLQVDDDESEFHLIELDWSPELWVAYHDVDEQNACLASRVCEGNGFDHAEGYVGDVLDFLGASRCLAGSYRIS